jgi:hypothetical protein
MAKSVAQWRASERRLKSEIALLHLKLRSLMGYADCVCEAYACGNKPRLVDLMANMRWYIRELRKG